MRFLAFLARGVTLEHPSLLPVFLSCVVREHNFLGKRLDCPPQLAVTTVPCFFGRLHRLHRHSRRGEGVHRREHSDATPTFYACRVDPPAKTLGKRGSIHTSQQATDRTVSRLLDRICTRVRRAQSLVSIGHCRRIRLRDSPGSIL